MSISLEKINLGTIWTMLAGTVLAVLYMFNTFVSASEFMEFKVDNWYTQYYILLEKRDHALERGKTELAAELSRQMERVRAKICEQNSEWDRCKP